MGGPICRILTKIRSSGCCVWTNIIYESPQRGLACLFYNLGCTIARRPWMFVLIPALLSLCLCIGALWINLETLDDVWDLYFPRDKPIASSAYKLRNTFVTSPNLTRTFCPYQTFGSSVSLPVLALTPYFGQIKTNSTNGIEANEGDSKPVKNYGLEALKALCNFVKDFTYQLSPEGDKMAFEDVCAYSIGDNCLEPIVCTAIKESNDANSIKIEPEFQPLVLPKSARVDPKTNQVTETVALRLVWHFRSKESNRITFSGSDNDPSAIFIRQLFDELYKVKDELGRGEGVTLHPYSQIVQSDEVHSIVKNDSKLMAITVLLMSLFSVLVSVNKRQGVLRSRALLALAGVLTTCLAIGSAVGFLAMLGVKFIQCAFLAPFIMLGIGIDSTFVIMFTWAKECSKSVKTTKTATTKALLPNITSNPSISPDATLNHVSFITQYDTSGRSRCSEVVVSERERVIGNTMKNSFIAVFISNTTALLAFLVGSFTPYQAVNITCYYLATITFFLLLLQSSFLIGCLSLYHDIATTTDRTKSGHQKTKKCVEQKKKRRVKVVQSARSSNGVDMLLNGHYEQENGAQLRAVQRTQNLVDQNENSLDTAGPISSHMRNNSSDQHSPNQTKLSLEHEAEEVCPEMHVEEDEGKVLNKLELFISGNLHKVVLSNYVRVAAVFLVGVALTLSISRVSKMRQFINEVYFTSTEMMLMERNSLMKESIWWSIAVAIVCCSGVAWLLLPKLFLFLTVISTLALTMTTTMGFMAIMGMHYNIATYIIVLLLIGLCIDYISHSGHAYLCASQQLSSRLNLANTPISPIETSTSTQTNKTGHQFGPMNDDAKREQIVRLALRNIGVPLTNAALSSLLSVSMLGFGSSYVMRNMFKSMMLLFSLSFFYGVIFLPIILSFFGPVPKNENENWVKVSKHAKIDMRDLSSQDAKEVDTGPNTSAARCKVNTKSLTESDT